MAHLSKNKEKFIAYWLRYPYWSSAQGLSYSPHKRLFGIIYGICVFGSVAFALYQMVGAPNIFRLETPRAVVRAFSQNRSTFNTQLQNVPAPSYCSLGGLKNLDTMVYPEASEVSLFLNDDEISTCEEFTETGAIVEESSTGYFVRTFRVIRDVKNKKNTYVYTKHPEYLSFGIKHFEVSHYVPDGIKTWTTGNEDHFAYGINEWSSLTKLFPSVNLDKINSDSFLGIRSTNPTATYRQTGIVVGVFIEYYNFPRSLSEISFGFETRAEINTKVMHGMRGSIGPKQVLETDGAVKTVIYDYGIHIDIVKVGYVGVIELNLIFACCASAFMFLYMIGSILDFLSLGQNDLQDVFNRGLDKTTDILSQKNVDSGKQKMSSVESNSHFGTSNSSLRPFDTSLFQVPFVREIYDDSAHDMERAMRARNRTAFGRRQDFMIASHSLKPALTPSFVDASLAIKKSATQQSKNVPGKSYDIVANDITTLNTTFDVVRYEQIMHAMVERMSRLEKNNHELKTGHHGLAKMISQRQETRDSNFSRTNNKAKEI